jgi:hypothetical protein
VSMIRSSSLVSLGEGIATSVYYNML